ncbi:tRNA(Met) cytidine acetyltransferase TmcA [Natrarchaeobaculum sulfurireducens]|uniref:tRNA(Met) cytidine acetyltransferase TmcA n=1 Tax=Natrarchaeobaculum sulfurireducens TaxID=2044521 RepID=A0A346PSP8_9EURY|nr:tRNA(Met) cytidine acetyltransferase TmcA [Natrarchaeobaculum sulfurireducens]AXR82543.1 putative P-loop ATPase fused to anacetyltransferase [Natrarchaeobaculum sulfurireducens]
MSFDVVGLAESLAGEASATNERRLLVLSGERERGYAALESVLDALPVAITATTLVGPDDRLRCEQVTQAHARKLLGTTQAVVALDVHDGLRPNALGTVTGAVDGGGLLVLLTPPLESWSEVQDTFDESLAVPPYSLADVTSRFRDRLVETLYAHRGIAVVDLEAERIEDDGLTRPAPQRTESTPPLEAPADASFPTAVYEACQTADQVDAVGAFESLGAADEGTARAVVLEADRGRGKSSAAGLAAGALAASGEDVLVTAPRWRNAREVFERARERLVALDRLAESASRRLETTTGGCIRFRTPTLLVDDGSLDGADIVIVDEAAALPVRLLESLLAADRIAFATTIHGYEGAGRGFSVRFRDRLAERDHVVEARTLREPIRYAAGDPVEVWAFRALLLDARPPVDPLVADADPGAVEYRRLEHDELLTDEPVLREAFGLLVLAHYRTEPNDLARLLDAPNLEARALVYDGHVVSVALLAREGGLADKTRAEMYEGGRVRGNMLPDVLTSQLRDESAGDPVGIRVVRIATHHAVRSQGLGSHLLERIRTEFAENVDWLGTSFGATARLLSFWRENGYRTVHVSTTRNDASGEYSALMLAPTSEAGWALCDRHTTWFARRFPSVCADTLRDLEPDVARLALRSVPPESAPPVELSDHEWRVVAGAAYGPGLFDVDPRPFRQLAVRYFLDDPDAVDLSAREERLLVLRALQGRDWASVAEGLEYHSTGQCMRAIGEAFCPLIDHYGTGTALEARDRFRG